MNLNNQDCSSTRRRCPPSASLCLCSGILTPCFSGHPPCTRPRVNCCGGGRAGRQGLLHCDRQGDTGWKHCDTGRNLGNGVLQGLCCRPVAPPTGPAPAKAAALCTPCAHPCRATVPPSCAAQRGAQRCLKQQPKGAKKGAPANDQKDAFLRP